jgi:hypothetical protein
MPTGTGNAFDIVLHDSVIAALAQLVFCSEGAS